jgi:hypothetical protein
VIVRLDALNAPLHFTHVLEVLVHGRWSGRPEPAPEFRDVARNPVEKLRSVRRRTDRSQRYRPDPNSLIEDHARITNRGSGCV